MRSSCECCSGWSDAGLLDGKTVGIDATTLEANAALRSIVRRDTGEGCEAFLRGLAASGIPTQPPAESVGDACDATSATARSLGSIFRDGLDRRDHRPTRPPVAAPDCDRHNGFRSQRIPPNRSQPDGANNIGGDGSNCASDGHRVATPATAAVTGSDPAFRRWSGTGGGVLITRLRRRRWGALPVKLSLAGRLNTVSFRAVRPGAGRVSGTGRPRRPTTRARLSRRRWRTWSLTRSRPPTPGSDLFERRRRLMNDWATYLNGERRPDDSPRR